MVFSSLIFLYGFLPLCLLGYWVTPSTKRNHFLVAASLVFYAWGEPLFVAVLVTLSLTLYPLSKALAPDSAVSRGRRRATLVFCLTLVLGLLLVCKYTGFALEQVNAVRAWLGRDAWTVVPWALPLGISFFTFQKVSYLVDVYRGTTRPARTLTEFFLFVTFFPQLIAGPIIRYHEIADQLRERPDRASDFLNGFARFSLGLGRKVLIANPLGQTADALFALTAETLPMPHAWLAVAAYTFQIYFDFAGYSDMAIGLARMFGFRFPENFDRPYTARSITEFWRRWHMTLGAFMREYLYVPLGGNRAGPTRTAINLWIVFLLSGFWHGAAWTFVLWGAWHGLWLSVERVIGEKRLLVVPGWIRNGITLLLVALGWVLFRATSLEQALTLTSRLVAWGEWTFVPPRFETLWLELLPNRTAFVLILAAICSLWKFDHLSRRHLEDPQDAPRRWALVGAVTLVVLSTAALASQSYNPFIYFRF